MSQIIQLSLTPIQAHNSENIQEAISQQLNISKENITDFRLLKRSIDARKRKVKIQLKAEVFINEKIPQYIIERNYQDVRNKQEVIVVGSGPAGLFASLKLIEHGLKPIILERGKDVQSRRRDIADINKKQIVNPNSNYCFGEGGAGTYSDGKLYTRSKKRGSIKSVLETLVYHGAREEILVDAQPHIGTNKLPKLIASIRDTIIKSGGEIYYNNKVTDFIIKDNSIYGVVTEKGDEILGISVILATGHSASDILHKNSGGFIVPAATAPGEIVVNGMSPSKRDSIYANSGIVVEVKNEDLIPFQQYGSLAGLYYQMSIEKIACEAGQNLQIAPAQRMTDFIKNKISPKLNNTSYQPGIISTPLHELLPEAISLSLKKGLKYFDKKMKGYLTNEANILGVESRTSSPISIPRFKDTLQHIQIKNLYPCGEGAGYAGGIVSAAIDGERCALKICSNS